MKNEKLNKGIEDIKKIKLSVDEKENILKNIVFFTEAEPIRSSWNLSPLTLLIRNHRFVSSLTFVSLIIFSGSGLVFASQDSLPGDILYSIKVNIIEPINSTFNLTPEGQVAYESSLAVKRLKEAESLINQRRFDVSKEKKLEDLLSKHTDKINNALNRIHENDSPDEIDNIVVNFQAEMNAHARVLDNLNNEDTQNKNDEIKISDTARVNGDRLRNHFKNNENDIPKEFNQKRKDIQSIIDLTSSQLGNIKENNSKNKQKIIEDTNTTLDTAKQFLEKSEDQNKQGDRNNAYSSLLDSESTAKEANILLKEGLRFEDNKNESN